MPRRVMIWDLGGIFVHYVPMFRDPVFLLKCKVEQEVLESFCSGRVWHAYECGKMTSEEFFRQFKEETDYSGDFHEFLYDFSNTMSLNQEMYDYFQHLRFARKNLDHWLLSNLNPLHYEAVFTRRGDKGWPGILSSFAERFVFFSHIIHMRKGTHDPELWEHILMDGEAEPGECVFTDDKQENGVWPAKIGVAFVHYDGDFEKFKLAMASALGK